MKAMGAFLRHAPRRENRTPSRSFSENFSHIQRISGNSPSAVGVLDLVSSSIKPFPLLHDDAIYNPDTTDLTRDPQLQHYWIDLLDKNLSNLVAMVVDWQEDGNGEALKMRAASFESM